MPRGHPENYLVATGHTVQELKKRKRNGISDFRIINIWAIIKVMGIDTRTR